MNRHLIGLIELEGLVWEGWKVWEDWQDWEVLEGSIGLARLEGLVRVGIDCAGFLRIAKDSQDW